MLEVWILASYLTKSGWTFSVALNDSYLEKHWMNAIIEKINVPEV